jgi:hypothetical protein
VQNIYEETVQFSDEDYRLMMQMGYISGSLRRALLTTIPTKGFSPLELAFVRRRALA